MYSFLLDRHHASDVDGAFTINILKVSNHYAGAIFSLDIGELTSHVRV